MKFLIYINWEKIILKPDPMANDTAGIKPQTSTFHLSKMVSAGIIEKYVYCRYRYFKLANEDIAKLLEFLMKLSKSPKINSLNQYIHSHALRDARLCYDHIAGKLGYIIADGLIDLCWIKKSPISRELEVTEVGKVDLYKNFPY